jgi:uncharacterized protein (TIGR03066 family)
MKRLLSVVIATALSAMLQAQQATPEPSQGFMGKWDLTAPRRPDHAELEVTRDGATIHAVFVLSGKSSSLTGRVTGNTLTMEPSSKSEDEWQSTWTFQIATDGHLSGKESSCAETSNGYMCKIFEFTGQRLK